MNGGPLNFYFDFISPYGYLASLRVDELAARHGRTVDWHAMLLGVSVMKVMGLKPLMETPLKSDYVLRDLRRSIRNLGLNIARDLEAPVGDPLPAARAFHWVKHHHPQVAGAVAAAIYDAYWRQGQDLSTARAVASVALPAGLDAGTLETAVGSDEARTLLRHAVEASLKAGVFGSPTVIVDGEMFWGADRLPEVDEWLTRGGW